MPANKIVYAGRVLIDLTGITVTPEMLAEGITAIDAAGNLIIGTAKFASEEKAICGEAACGTVICGDV